MLDDWQLQLLLPYYSAGHQLPHLWISQEQHWQRCLCCWLCLPRHLYLQHTAIGSRKDSICPEQAPTSLALLPGLSLRLTLFCQGLQALAKCIKNLIHTFTKEGNSASTMTALSILLELKIDNVSICLAEYNYDHHYHHCQHADNY